MVGRADATLLAGDWVRAKLSVREAEAALAGGKQHLALKGATGKRGKQSKSDILRDANTDDLERRMSAALGVKVRIMHKKGTQSGVFQVYYSTLDQLDDLIDRIGGTSVPGIKPGPNQVTHALRKQRGE